MTTADDEMRAVDLPFRFDSRLDRVTLEPDPDDPDADLYTAYLASLLTDRRRPAHVGPPVPISGFAGDLIDGRETGSLLYLLSGARLDAETIARAERYADQALAWMVEAGVAVSVRSVGAAEPPDRIRLTTTIERARPDAPPRRYTLAVSLRD